MLGQVILDTVSQAWLEVGNHHLPSAGPTAHHAACEAFGPAATWACVHPTAPQARKLMAFPSELSPAIITQVHPSQVWYPAFVLAECHKVPVGRCLLPARIPPGGSVPLWQGPPSLVSSADWLRVRSASCPRPAIKVLNKKGPRINPCSTSLTTGLQFIFMSCNINHHRRLSGYSFQSSEQIQIFFGVLQTNLEGWARAV